MEENPSGNRRMDVRAMARGKRRNEMANSITYNPTNETFTLTIKLHAPRKSNGPGGTYLVGEFHGLAEGVLDGHNVRVGCNLMVKPEVAVELGGKPTSKARK